MRGGKSARDWRHFTLELYDRVFPALAESILLFYKVFGGLRNRTHAMGANMPGQG